MLTVNDVVLEIEKLAKPSYAYEWDNCGLLAGNLKQSVKQVLVSLDITKEVVLEAIEKECQMIISHHPLIFKGIKDASVSTYEGEILSLLYKNDISLYSAHTSLDIARGGVNDALCKKLKLKNVELLSSFEVGGETVACARCGKLEKSMTKAKLIDYVKEKTGAKQLLYNLEEKEYKTVALCTGAGEEFAFESKGCDVFLTGEIKYHTALELKRQNISFICAGHYYTEVHMIDALVDSLQKNTDMIKYIRSSIKTNPFEN